MARVCGQVRACRRRILGRRSDLVRVASAAAERNRVPATDLAGEPGLPVGALPEKAVDRTEHRALDLARCPWLCGVVLEVDHYDERILRAKGVG